jgi:AcrR family transcriptional regulator
MLREPRWLPGNENEEMASKTSELTEVPARRKSAPRAAVRLGRPPKQLEGEVEERILDAARKLFLQRGFEGTSVDEIAVAARSGKPTIYARVGDKRALFIAVVMRDVISKITQFNSEVPTGGTIEERLTQLATALLHWVLDDEKMALMRLAIAEVNRFPDLASTVSRTAQRLSTEVAARYLGEMAKSDDLGRLPAFSPDRLALTARFFLDLTVLPIMLRGLYEQHVSGLREEIEAQAKRRAAFFLAACRQDG